PGCIQLPNLVIAPVEPECSLPNLLHWPRYYFDKDLSLQAHLEDFLKPRLGLKSSLRGGHGRIRMDPAFLRPRSHDGSREL
uniref:HEXDC n=1 Tax=Macrostomum lignano TaxID=282301 RepID=A0A1I8F8X4_9PLAT